MQLNPSSSPLCVKPPQFGMALHQDTKDFLDQAKTRIDLNKKHAEDVQARNQEAKNTAEQHRKTKRREKLLHAQIATIISDSFVPQTDEKIRRIVDAYLAFTDRGEMPDWPHVLLPVVAKLVPLLNSISPEAALELAKETGSKYGQNTAPKDGIIANIALRAAGRIIHKPSVWTHLYHYFKNA